MSESFKPKILVVRQLALGDVLLATPIIKQLFLDYSGDCEIDVLTLKPDVFIGNPYVNNVLSPNDYLEQDKFYQKIINLDLAYESMPNMHVIEAYAKYSHGSKDLVVDKRVQLYASKKDYEFIYNLTNKLSSRRFLVLHMRRDTWPSRNLSEKTWSLIVSELLANTDAIIVQVGSGHEISFEEHPRLINLLGKLTIQQLKVLIEKSSCYVGIDSGTLHVAASTDTPIVSIFTSAHHQFREPIGRNDNSLFIPIVPMIECYACQSRIKPPITGVVCERGDPYSPPCIDLIPIDKLISGVRIALGVG